MKAEKFFVIGSNSFTGATFVGYLLARGCEVIGTTRSPEPASVFLPYKWPAQRPAGAQFKFAQLDLNHATEGLAAAMREFEPSYVVNFAAQSMVAESWLYPDQWYQTNVVANVKLHEKIRQFPFLKKYVHVSTPEVYGNCRGNVTEAAPFNPSTPYAASRAACDLHLLTFFKNYQFPVAFTRAANVYGPGQQLYRIVPRAIFFIKTGRKLQLHGGGRSVRSFIHARDVAEGTWRVAHHGVPGEAYHFSTDLYVSIRELVERICARLGVSFNDVVEVVGDRPGKDAAYLLDSSKAQKTLGWKDSISLNQGIDETIGWITHNLEELKRQPSDYIHKP
ncbi:MAG TPA: GDP-mannose 4,6-dehydratase [Verrucomicrobiae bacterium]|nr:GDP-mannose 4,6-dehydratase [Verrucomicrobiae bacterium]